MAVLYALVCFLGNILFMVGAGFSLVDAGVSDFGFVLIVTAYFLAVFVAVYVVLISQPRIARDSMLAAIAAPWFFVTAVLLPQLDKIPETYGNLVFLFAPLIVCLLRLPGELFVARLNWRLK